MKPILSLKRINKKHLASTLAIVIGTGIILCGCKSAKKPASTKTTMVTPMARLPEKNTITVAVARETPSTPPSPLILPRTAEQASSIRSSQASKTSNKKLLEAPQDIQQLIEELTTGGAGLIESLLELEESNEEEELEKKIERAVEALRKAIGEAIGEALKLLESLKEGIKSGLSFTAIEIIAALDDATMKAEQVIKHAKK